MQAYMNANAYFAFRCSTDAERARIALIFGLCTRINTHFPGAEFVDAYYPVPMAGVFLEVLWLALLTY